MTATLKWKEEKCLLGTPQLHGRSIHQRFGGKRQQCDVTERESTEDERSALSMERQKIITTNNEATMAADERSPLSVSPHGGKKSDLFFYLFLLLLCWIDFGFLLISASQWQRCE